MLTKWILAKIKRHKAQMLYQNNFQSQFPPTFTIVYEDVHPKLSSAISSSSLSFSIKGLFHTSKLSVNVSFNLICLCHLEIYLIRFDITVMYPSLVCTPLAALPGGMNRG